MILGERIWIRSGASSADKEVETVKICILSMQRINNMGSLLQSYALKKTLEGMNSQVEFLDIKRDEADSKLLEFRKRYQKEKEATGWIGKLRKIDRYCWNRLRIRRRATQQNVLFERFRENQLHLEQRSPRYELCVIGSDEVFNCLDGGSWGFTSQLFGNVSQADQVITYAASCGSTTYQETPQAVRDRIRSSFKRVRAFSARDKNTHDFISHLTEQEIADHLDPVLIYDFKREVDEVVLPKLPDRYCIVYSYYNRIHTKEEIQAIQAFCKKHSLTPVAVGAPQFWLKEYVVCSPFQCLKIFQHAEFVITDTFHGTIFSTKYAPRFAVLVRKSNQNKLVDLMEKLKIIDHRMHSIAELDEKYALKKDVAAIEQILREQSSCSADYLRRYAYSE